MNPTDPHPAPSTSTPMAAHDMGVHPAEFEAWLDRLVDGEISEPQRSALLRELERRPGGWRQCALVFLEAQAWRQALDNNSLVSDSPENDPLARRSLAHAMSPDESMRRTDDRPSAHRRASSWRPVLGLLAAAASFALAFGLGIVVQSKWFAGTTSFVAGSPAGTKQASLGSPKDAIATQTVAGAAQPVARGANESLRNDTADSSPAKSRWGTVQVLVADQHGTPQQVELPVVDGPDASEWLRKQPATVPTEMMLELLRRQGHHVETQRHYVPVPLDDGRNAVFPVDRVEVRYLGGRGYQ